MIPKVIHYIWFGGKEKGEKVERCIASWRKFCPDYRIIEWNESNYDVTKHPFIRQAYAAKKWAFVSDYARVDVLYQQGGIYLDTDVELLKSLDDFLKYDFFLGFESEDYVNLGLGGGAVKGHPVLREILKCYDELKFSRDSFGLSLVTSPRIQTEVLQRHGLICNDQNQVVDGCHIFNTEYFCPMSFRTGQCRITDKTVSIHHYDMSWCTDGDKRRKTVEWWLVGRLGPKWGRQVSLVLTFPGKLFARAKEGTLLEYIRFLAKRNL